MIKSNENKKLIDSIEDRLKELEKEKNEIESLYGIDENILQTYKKPTANKTNSSKNIQKTSLYNNLPKLETTHKKDKSISYKTPDTLQDSLRYEPNIKDLYSEKEFEPSFINIDNLKVKPSIQRGFNISNFIGNADMQFIKKYINN
jgi:hypothetical protein